MAYDKKSFILGLATGLATRGVLRNPAKEEQQEGAYLTFSSLGSFTLAVYNAKKNWDGTLEYSTDTKNWIAWDGTTTLASGTRNSLYLRGSGNTRITSIQTGARWVLSGASISCSGNIESLLDYDDVSNGLHPTMATYCFGNMFRNCTALITPPDLPAMTLAGGCYSNMFSGCTSLTTPPELPATILEHSCYLGMFQSCTGLLSAPALPATTLADDCYRVMFSGCTSLTTPPELPATILESNCYFRMFQSCTGLLSAPVLPATTLANDCYEKMFSMCTSLKSIPTLAAKTMANYCYYDMFEGCTSIKLSATQIGEYQTAFRIPATGTGSNATEALNGMFDGTGGTFTGTPTINTTYYTSNEVV